MFQAPKLTNAGKALYYDNMAGTQLKFTTIKLGSGTLSGPIANLTNLVNTVVTIDATATPYEDYANVAGAFSNAQLAAGFYWREIGVFAANPSDPDNRAADILYCYQNAYDTADFIPVASVETVEKNITVPVIVGDATAVSCTLSKSLVFVTQQDLEDQKGGANGLASLDANGKITPAQVDYLLKTIVAAADYDPTATYAVRDYRTHEGTLYKCTTAITAAEAWNAAHWAETSVAAEFAALYTALEGKAATNHTHTAEQVGADPSGSAAAVQGNLDAHMGNTTAHLTASERTAWNGKANTVTLTCTVPVSWTASGDYFYQNVSVPGMLAADNPTPGILFGSDNAANKLYDEAFGKVLHITTYDGGAQIWCTEAPTVAFPLQFKVVR